MKGWILTEKGKPVITSIKSIEVFKTKEDLFDYYGGALGEQNGVVKVNINIKGD
jgi:hypothetical protein